MSNTRTLSWHKYKIRTQDLPTKLYRQLQRAVGARRGVLWDTDYQGNLIVNVLDDDPWSTWFAVTYSEYIIESLLGETEFTVTKTRPAVGVQVYTVDNCGEAKGPL